MPPARDSLERLGWRLDALDKWRSTVDTRLLRLEDTVEAMTRADEITREVAKRVKQERSLHLTGWQRLGALLVGALVAFDSARGLF